MFGVGLGGGRIKTSFCMHFENLLVKKNENSLISGGLVFTIKRIPVHSGRQSTFKPAILVTN